MEYLTSVNGYFVSLTRLPFTVYYIQQELEWQLTSAIFYSKCIIYKLPVTTIIFKLSVCLM